MKTYEEKIAAIIAWFEDHKDVFNDAIEQLDSYDGYLGDDHYYSMDELDELLGEQTPTTLLNLAFFGHDEDSWTTDSSGNKTYGAFNPNRDYFRFNGYGNLVSTDYKDYSDHLDKYAVEDMNRSRFYVDAIDENDELAALFDALDEDEEGEEDEEEEEAAQA